MLVVTIQPSFHPGMTVAESEHS